MSPVTAAGSRFWPECRWPVIWRGTIVILPFGMFTACASAPNSSAGREAPEAPDAIEGTYEYSATIPGQHVRGTLRVAADTMVIDIETGVCEPTKVPDPNVIRYVCPGVSLAFDRRNPVRRSSWSTNVTVRQRREVCAQYEVRSGREVCVRRAMETYETLQPRSGTLQIRRKST